MTGDLVAKDHQLQPFHGPGPARQTVGGLSRWVGPAWALSLGMITGHLAFGLWWCGPFALVAAWVGAHPVLKLRSWRGRR